MWRKPTLEACVQALAAQMLDRDGLKAVMMAKNADGDVVVTFVEGVEDSHKVRFGKVDHRSRAIVRFPRPQRDDGSGQRPAHA